MNKQTQPPPREHHFYVAIAKFLFHHPEHGIVSVQDPIKIKSAEQYGLSPLMLYGLTVVGLPIQWITFSPVDQPRAIRDVLLEAWCKAEGLCGRPDILWINRHLVMDSPELVSEMAKIGVRVHVADAKEKSLPASLRSAQNSSKWLLMMERYDRKTCSLTESIQALCRAAYYKHNFQIRGGYRGTNSREVEDRIQQWLALPTQVPELISTGELDWKPGAWLSSWETPLPPDQPRYFYLDGANGSTWLLTGEKFPERDHDNVTNIIKNLVACWPNPPAEIARCAGVTLRELQWFISKRAPLDRQARFDLEDLLGIEYDESMGDYVEVGPYVLMANKPLALKEVYESISNGGDARPCEIVPRLGTADPSWRYILINTYGEPPSLVMSPRGAKITERLPDLFMNYAGTTSVSPEFYRDVVSTCARACREPAANIREMKDFVKRHEACWANCAWQPE